MSPPLTPPTSSTGAKLIEIVEIPTLSPGELSLLDFHSIINVLNVLRCELMLLGEAIADDVDLLKQGLRRCEELMAAMSDPVATLKHAAEMDAFERNVLEELNRCLAKSTLEPKQLLESLVNLRTVLKILTLRAREVLARAAAPERWESLSVRQIESDFRELLVAFERTSKGRFRILTNAALQTANDYYADLKFEAPADPLLLPPIFVDVMRDLIANARKYTAPGGDITAALHQDLSGTHFVVKDTGRGIPADEIEQVVHFGRRASNVGTVRTMGGGFGLTKAFLVTKQFGGRFWICSELGKGTEVRIWLPPHTAAA